MVWLLLLVLLVLLLVLLLLVLLLLLVSRFGNIPWSDDIVERSGLVRGIFIGTRDINNCERCCGQCVTRKRGGGGGHWQG